ncbi:hypothetical protein VM95_29515 [Streptomyces rubellomurinus]|uniref:Uncharacterized protein n=1 Tax=Streptomyces rubellomurinus (strain ATCC 31215) TaxID=359131 RepID=A0A0F2T743_STRR3|nr:hypothetical protein VM95_29515 [Streptomyces rubellomurinus]
MRNPSRWPRSFASPPGGGPCAVPRVPPRAVPGRPVCPAPGRASPDFPGAACAPWRPHCVGRGRGRGGCRVRRRGGTVAWRCGRGRGGSTSGWGGCERMGPGRPRSAPVARREPVAA